MNAESVVAWNDFPSMLQLPTHTRTNPDITQHTYRMRKQVMEEICGLQTSPGELDRLQLLLGVDIPRGAQPICMAVKLDWGDRSMASQQHAHFQTVKYELFRTIEEAFTQSDAGGFCSEMGLNRIAVVYYVQHVHSRRQMEERGGAFAYELSAVIQQHFHAAVSIGLSDAKASLNEIAVGWREASACLDFAFYSGSGGVITPPVSVPNSSSQSVRLERYFDSLYAALQHHDRHEAEVLLVEIETCARRYRIAPTSLLDLYGWLAAKLNQASDSQLSSIRQDDVDFRQYVIRLRALCEAAWSPRPSLERDEIRKALDYMDMHYAEDIYLEEVARHVNLNPAYLSTLFNQEMNMGLSEYINRKRIEVAMKLLHHRLYSNVELAEAVGIQNERYFCTLFKKYAGIPPQKYRVASKLR